MESIQFFLYHYWPYFVDFFILGLCIALIAAYQFRLRRHVRKHPETTILAVTAQARLAWLHRVMNSHGLEVMAVQTFRNSIMAATLMASTAVILIFGILNLVANADKIGPVLHGINTWGSQDPELWILKLMLPLVDFFVAFFCFALAVRGYHHAGYLVNAPLGAEHGVTVEKVIALLDRTARYYSIGMRTYYYSVPLVLWLFGPIWMLISTMVLLAVLYHLDHLPD